MNSYLVFGVRHSVFVLRPKAKETAPMPISKGHHFVSEDRRRTSLRMRINQLSIIIVQSSLLRYADLPTHLHYEGVTLI